MTWTEITHAQYQRDDREHASGRITDLLPALWNPRMGIRGEWKAQFRRSVVRPVRSYGLSHERTEETGSRYVTAGDSIHLMAQGTERFRKTLS